MNPLVNYLFNIVIIKLYQGGEGEEDVSDENSWIYGYISWKCEMC